MTDNITLRRWVNANDDAPETEFQRGYDAARRWVREVGLPALAEPKKERAETVIPARGVAGSEKPASQRGAAYRITEPPAIAELFAQFAAKQKPLDADMAAIINANLDSLYITDEPAAAPPAAAKPEPATDEQAAAAYDGKRGTRQWVDFRDGWLHAERFHGIRGSK